VFVLFLSQLFCFHLTASCSIINPVLHENCLARKNVSITGGQSSYNEKNFLCTDETSCSFEDDGDDQHTGKPVSYSTPFLFPRLSPGFREFLSAPEFFSPPSAKRIIILQSVLKI
jgi:hypothetical protein